MRLLPDPLERLHAALALPVACACAAGFPVLAIGDRVVRERVQIAVAAGATAVAAGWWITSAGLTWFRRHGAPSPESTAPPGRVLAAVTGALLGLFAGLYEDAAPFGLHLGAACAYFVLLPLALLACLPRRPAWRPFADIVLLVVGAEAGAQAGFSYAKWGEPTWWDDISGIHLVYVEIALAAAVAWFVVSYRVRRRAVTRPDGDVPPPRKPA